MILLTIGPKYSFSHTMSRTPGGIPHDRGQPIPDPDKEPKPDGVLVTGGVGPVRVEFLQLIQLIQLIRLIQIIRLAQLARLTRLTRPGLLRAAPAPADDAPAL